MRRYKKVYILCPANATTGGPEALHQLCDAMILQGIDAFIVYVKKSSFLFFNNRLSIDMIAKTPSRYAHYNTPISCEIDLDKSNLLIFPEVWTDYLSNFPHIKKMIWWLSVDNNRNRFSNFKDESILHAYQSQYAAHFLIQNGVRKVYPLFDYISILISSKSKKKKNCVCYNPKKGFLFTKEIMQKIGDKCNFVSLEGLSSELLSEKLSESKVYIDFGHHPGKDRIPREAALNNCIVITSKKGSAFFDLDVPIPLLYKLFDADINEACDLILESLNNYDSKIAHFTPYKEQIKNQRQEFFDQVKCLFS